jgi:hypothetical protein
MEVQNGIRFCRVCKLGSNVSKFVIKNTKIYGKRCKKCNSDANNKRLKNKQYYNVYCLKNKEMNEGKTHEQYLNNNSLNVVRFDFLK